MPEREIIACIGSNDMLTRSAHQNTKGLHREISLIKVAIVMCNRDRCSRFINIIIALYETLAH